MEHSEQRHIADISNQATEKGTSFRYPNDTFETHPDAADCNFLTFLHRSLITQHGLRPEFIVTTRLREVIVRLSNRNREVPISIEDIRACSVEDKNTGDIEFDLKKFEDMVKTT